jgi:hypothetical protein
MKACFVAGIDAKSGEFVLLYAGLDANVAMDTFKKVRTDRGQLENGVQLAGAASFIRPPTSKRGKFEPSPLPGRPDKTPEARAARAKKQADREAAAKKAKADATPAKPAKGKPPAAKTKGKPGGDESFDDGGKE